jgi:hypothetical protein
MVHTFLVSSDVSSWHMEVMFMSGIYAEYFCTYFKFLHVANDERQQW